MGDADTWDFWCYLSGVIYNGLIHLKKHAYGYPITLAEKNKNFDEIDWEAELKNWNIIIDKMIYAFKLANEIGHGGKRILFPHL